MWLGSVATSLDNDQTQTSVDQSIDSVEWDSLFTELEDQVISNQETSHEASATESFSYACDFNMEEATKENVLASRHLQGPPRYHHYNFQTENPFLGSWRAFEEGMAILHKEQNLAFATLAFEAACQKDTLNFEAWKMLGSTQAENENDEAAMKAFEYALELDPTHSDALLGLAITYINGGSFMRLHHSMSLATNPFLTGHQQKAYGALENWLTAKYPQIASDELPSDDLLTRITSLYLSAARLHPSGPQLDPGVQIGLGMLFFSTSHYTESLDCFSAALSLTLSSPIPTTARSANSQCQAHLLYNRIGASLAKLRRYEEAVEAYEMALVARSNFVKARYNLAVLALNRGEYEEAARHAIRALIEREAGRTPTGKQEKTTDVEDDLLSALRKALANMGRWDLSEMVGPGMSLVSLRRALDV
jgi:peroxin-5